VAAPSDAPEATPSPEAESLDGAEMTSEQLAEAKRYGRAGLVCTLADKGLDLAYFAVMALLFARPIDAWLNTCPVLHRFWTLRLLAMFLIVLLVHVAVSFGLSFYSGFVVEHRYKLSRLTFRGWLWLYAKDMALHAAFGAVLWPGLFWLIWLTGQYWWLYAAGAFFVLMIVMGQLAPILILPLYFKTEKLDYPELAERISRLADVAGLSIQGVYRLILSEQTAKANAMLTGLGRTRRVLLGDNLLEAFTLDEITVVFAHEIGHHVYRHIRKLILGGLLAALVGFWLCDKMLWLWAGGYGGDLDYSQLPVAALPYLALVMFVFGNLSQPLAGAVSRHFERQADRYALEQTGLGDAFVSAFRKLAKLNKADPDPHWLKVKLFYSHPPIAERVAIVEKSGQKSGQRTEDRGQ